MKKLIRVDGDLAYVPLTQGKVAVVDASAVPLIEKHSWHFDKGYAATKARDENGQRRHLFMHRLISATPEGFDTDHINMDRLDNRSANLRHATRAENLRNVPARSCNTSGFKGVSWNVATKKWQAHIRFDGKQHSLGHHLTPEDAFAAYCNAAKQMHGEFARAA